MFVLVEPLHSIGYNPVPSLGCAMLAAACAERGHEIRVIAGQEPLARRLFVDHVDELWDLYPKEPDGRAKSFVDGLVRPLGRNQFVAHHRDLYRRVYVDKTVRSFLAQPDELFTLVLCLRRAMEVYGAYVDGPSPQPLRLVDDFVGEILSSEPDVVGFSLLDHPPLTRAIVARLRAVSEVPVVAGGAATPHLTARECDTLLRPHQFDRLIVGPAERTLPDLLDRIAAGRSIDDLPNSVHRQGGVVRRTETIPAVDLDLLPFPDFTQIDLERLPTPVRFLPIQSGRGCSWQKCAFCNWTQQYFGQRYQAFGVERLIDTIAHLRETYDTTFFTLQDTELPAPRARKIAHALIDRFGPRGVNIAIYFNRLTKGYDDAELLTLMRRAGFVAVQWGLESGCDRVLALMNKGTDVATGGSIIDKAKAAGISNHVSVLFGFPGETRAEAQQTVDHLVVHRHAIDGLGVMSSYYFQDDSLIGQHIERWGGVRDEAGEITWSDGSITGPQADAFLTSFKTKLEFGTLEVTSAPVAAHPYLHGNFIQCAVMRAHDLTASEIVDEELRRDDGAGLVPLFAGAFTEDDGRPVFAIRSLAESSWIASLHAPRLRPVTAAERAAIELADGTRTIAGIAATLAERGLAAPADARELVSELVREAGRDSWALVFGRVWPAASQPARPVSA